MILSQVPVVPASALDESISIFWIIPFVLLLGCIALMPFIRKHWWEKWYPAVAVGLGVIPASYYWFAAPSPARWLEGMGDYVSFIILLASLFIISGGIVIHVLRKATPLTNCILLLFGAVAANIFGTTGASMLLIRPYLRMNRGHIRPFHVIFFIFIVSNVGGVLTPIGDPPLFLGYLKGVPFWWVLRECRWAWLVVVGILLAVFFIIDTIEHGKADRHSPEDPGAAVQIVGIHNLLLIAVVIWAVFQPGFFEIMHDMHQAGSAAGLWGRFLLSREVLMVAAAAASRLLTGKVIYQRNEFSYGPIREVAILFIGIFSTMIPALQWLNVNAHRLPIRSPGQFYFSSGVLSSVLDNAPTYLTFLEVELGKIDRDEVKMAAGELERMADARSLEVRPGLPENVREALGAVVQYHPDLVREKAVTPEQLEVAFLLGDPLLNLYIVAISMGAVFFGACTYIGNGPNFMVKSIADAGGVKMPGFIGYIVRYTLPVLVPTYIVVWWIFLARH